MRRPVVCVSPDVGASNHDLFFAGVCGTLVLIGWIRTCTCLCVSKNDVIFFLGMNCLLSHVRPVNMFYLKFLFHLNRYFCRVILTTDANQHINSDF